MKIFNKGFNFSQDGPGNRLVYHLQGCNMSCIWCSNPEGMPIHGGKEISPDEILEECISCRMMFFSGGGVTFTGGEATLQHDELLSLLSALQKESINTCIETNGTSKRLIELAEYVDYLIMDFKHHDEKQLRQYTGADIGNIKNNFEALCAMGRQLHIRIPLISGINTEYPEKFAEYFAGQDTSNVVFEFLRYHEFGKAKWKEEYKIKDGFVSDETYTGFVKTFRDNGLKLINT